MKIIFFVLSSALFYQCSNNHSNVLDDKSNQSVVIDKMGHCIQDGGEEFQFFYDDFSSEGAEGRLYFENDTLINKILFTYATSMVYTEQEYWFDKNKLIRYKQKINYIEPNKSDYIGEDSVVLEGGHIAKNKSFNDTLYQKLLRTASDKNPCWKISDN